VVLLTSTIYTVMLIDDACFHVIVYVIAAYVLLINRSNFCKLFDTFNKGLHVAV